MAAEKLKAMPLVLLGVFVCLAGTFVGGFFGMLASLMYDEGDILPEGIFLGAGGGLAAGLLWRHVIIRRAARGGGALVACGALWGLLVGVLDTLFVHAGLTITTWSCDVGAFLLGLAFGAAAGASVGAVCGLLCWAAAAWARRGVAEMVE